MVSCLARYALSNTAFLADLGAAWAKLAGKDRFAGPEARRCRGAAGTLRPVTFT